MRKTEIYLLAGFLGTGKTTFLKQILSSEKENQRKVAVLMNELGEISIDSDSVEEDVPLKELLGGCICCTIQDKLEAQLQGLLAEHDLDAIYIEATGAAHPVEVLDAVLSPLFAGKIEMRGIVTTVDGTLWADRRKLNPQVQQLLIEQVRHADLLLVNKSDLLSESIKAKVSMEIQNINQTAPCLFTTFSKIPLSMLKNLLHTKKGPSGSAHVKSNLRLGTFVYQFKKSISKACFEDFLRGLPEGIFRIKGYVKFEHSEYPDLFQYSYGTPLFMKEYLNLPLNLVFIGQDIAWEKVQDQLQQLEY